MKAPSKHRETPSEGTAVDAPDNPRLMRDEATGAPTTEAINAGFRSGLAVIGPGLTITLRLGACLAGVLWCGLLRVFGPRGL